MAVRSPTQEAEQAGSERPHRELAEDTCIAHDHSIDRLAQGILRQCAFEAFDIRQFRHRAVPLLRPSTSALHAAPTSAANLAAPPDKPGFDPRKHCALARVTVEIDRETFRQLFDCRQGVGIGLRPERPQFAQEDVHRDRSDAVKCEQSLLQIARIARSIVQPAQAATVTGNEHLTIAENLRRLAAIVAHVSALAHHRIDKKIPTGPQNLTRTGQTVPHEALICVLSRGFGNSRSKQ
jgi:hypothetical protein